MNDDEAALVTTEITCESLDVAGPNGRMMASSTASPQNKAPTIYLLLWLWEAIGMYLLYNPVAIFSMPRALASHSHPVP